MNVSSENHLQLVEYLESISMNTYTEQHQLNTNLTLHDTSQSPLTIHSVTLSLTKQDQELIECRLTLQITPQFYQHIDTNALFNLQPDIRNPWTPGEFQLEPDITIEAILKPDFVPQLAQHATTIDQAATYILSLTQAQPHHPILSTESWLGLSVTQPQESGEIGYTTFWSYLSPAAIAQTSVAPTEISQAIFNFFQKWTETNLVTKTANDQKLEEFHKIITELTDINMDEIIQEIQDNLSTTSTNEQIFAEVVNFFQTDDWPFMQITGQPILQTSYQGEHGEWTCYANTRVEQQQFIFYSVCPIKTPDDKRLAMAEFISRVNSGMVIGNFEIDFSDGEIRYKTSIDVEGDKLSFALINQLVYANVTTMDEYLQGIMSVIYGDLSPELVISQIEITSDIPTSSSENEQFSVITNSEQQLDLEINASSQVEVNQNETHILSILTPEEISEFHQISEMVAPYQRKRVEEMSNKLQNTIITRLGDTGVETFSKASVFFSEVKLAARNLKLIQRYAKLAGRTRLILEIFHNRSQQDEELLINLQMSTAILELKWLERQINQRLQELPTEKFAGRKEVELIIELEDFREKLNLSDQLLN